MFDPTTLKITADYPMPKELLQALKNLHTNGLPLVKVYNAGDWDYSAIPDSKEVVVSADLLLDQSAVRREAGKIGDNVGLMLTQCYHKRGWDEHISYQWWRLPGEKMPPCRIGKSQEDLENTIKIDWKKIHLLSFALSLLSMEGLLGTLRILAPIVNKPLRLIIYALHIKENRQPLGFIFEIRNRRDERLLVLGSTAYPGYFEEDRFWEIVSWPK